MTHTSPLLSDLPNIHLQGVMPPRHSIHTHISTPLDSHVLIRHSSPHSHPSVLHPQRNLPHSRLTRYLPHLLPDIRLWALTPSRHNSLSISVEILRSHRYLILCSVSYVFSCNSYCYRRLLICCRVARGPTSVVLLYSCHPVVLYSTSVQPE